jgi:hypothetical protein
MQSSARPWRKKGEHWQPFPHPQFALTFTLPHCHTLKQTHIYIHILSNSLEIRLTFKVTLTQLHSHNLSLLHSHSLSHTLSITVTCIPTHSHTHSQARPHIITNPAPPSVWCSHWPHRKSADASSQEAHLAVI